MNFSKLKFWGNDIIKFYCVPNLYGKIPEPKPAIKNFPEWFKDLEPQHMSPKDERDVFGQHPMTAKMCLPMIDAMALGYYIPLAADVRVRTNHDCTQFKVHHGDVHIVDFHDSYQVGGDHKIIKNQGRILKFINHWVIRTAPGWSTLFISPLNHFNAPFTAIAGMVDTDVYWKHVHFPVIWNVPDADMTITAGTPIVTAIPIKRDSFPKKPKVGLPTKKEIDEHNKIDTIQKFRSHYYTYELRKKK